jgi:hypothetical protein
VRQLYFHESLTLSDDSRSWKYKNDWMNVVLDVCLANHCALDGSRILEVGAGVHNPLGCALIALSWRCIEAVAVEPGAIHETHLADALTVGLVAQLHRPDSEQLRTALRILLAAHKGCVDADVSENLGAVRLTRRDIADAEIDGTFDVIHSNATLEHVVNLPLACKRMFALTKDGGLHIHKVDFIDHRYYNLDDPTNLDAFRFLLVGEEDILTDCNRLRVSEVVSLFRNAGFDVLPPHAIWRRDVPADALAQLQPRFRTLPSADIETTCAVLVFRKPA